jgi:hypothetical protein
VANSDSDPLGLKTYTIAARKKNLERGNRIRIAQKEMRLDLKAQKLDPYELIAGNNAELESLVRGMKISTVLKMVPGVGTVTRDELLRELGVSADVRFIALTYERREALAALLRSVLEPDASGEVPRT